LPGPLSDDALRRGGRSAAPRLRPSEAADVRLLYFACAALRLSASPLRHFESHLRRLSPLRGHECKRRASRHLPLLAAMFRSALRSWLTAPPFAARVPLREAITVFNPVFGLALRSTGLPVPLMTRPSDGGDGLAPAPSCGLSPAMDFVGLTQRSHQFMRKSRG